MKKSQSVLNIALSIVGMICLAVMVSEVYYNVFPKSESIVKKVEEKLNYHGVSVIYNITGCEVHYDLDGHIVAGDSTHEDCVHHDGDPKDIEINYVLIFGDGQLKYVGQVASDKIGMSGNFRTTHNIMLVSNSLEFRFYYRMGVFKEAFVSLENGCYYSFDNLETNCETADILIGESLREVHQEIIETWGISVEELDIYFTWLFNEYLDNNLES